MLSAFPMILIAVVVYNVAIFGGLAAGNDALAVLGQNFTIPMFAGDKWTITLGDLLVFLGLGMLFIETIKATRTTRREILNHAFSMLTFVVSLIEFIVLKGFGTSTFFFLMVMSLFDVVAGYTISIVTARRDLSIPSHNGNDY